MSNPKNIRAMFIYIYIYIYIYIWGVHIPPHEQDAIKGQF